MGFKEMVASGVSWCLDTGGLQQDTAMQVLTFSQDDAMIVSSIFSITAPIGFILMALWFMTGLLQDATHERDSDINMLVKNGIFLIVADLLLVNAPTIIGKLMSLSNSFMEDMITATQLANIDLSNTHVFNDDGLSLIALIVILVVGILGKLFGVIGAIITVIVCAASKIELMIRFAYAPIGMSSIADGGPRAHEAIRYLKKLFASAFQFGAIVLALYIANGITKTIITTPTVVNGNYLAFALSYLTNMLYSIVGPLAAVGAISTAKQLINEAFGV